ncbi:MAG: STAS domain-containing protein [Victivallaceae bacterium]|nr:STAS domain-containing protein [Victivallaceae bacterium]
MEIVLQNKNNYRYLSFSGRLDASTSQEADQQLRNQLDDCVKLLIDLEELTYISSAGLRVLLIIAKQMKNHDGDLVLCNLSDTVQEVFDISGFSAIFKLCPSTAAAEAALA